jgi:hypothetical protein
LALHRPPDIQRVRTWQETCGFGLAISPTGIVAAVSVMEPLPSTLDASASSTV